MSETVEQRCERIGMLILDVDGVLTDGRITYGDDGAEIKSFHVRDGSGLKFWMQAGMKAGIITGRRSPVVLRRAQELGVSAVVQGAEDKRAAYDGMLQAHGVVAAQVAYVGDDLPDVPLLRRSGLAVAVADACAETKQAAHHVTTAGGGQGAVREVIEMILRAQGRWAAVIGRYAP